MLPLAMKARIAAGEAWVFDDLAYRLGADADAVYVAELQAEVNRADHLYTRQLAVAALGYCVHFDLSAFFVGLAMDSACPPGVRGEALEQLAYRMVSSAPVEEAVLSCLTDSHPEVLRYAVFAAGMCKMEAAVPMLRAILHSAGGEASESVAGHREVREALRQIESP